MTICSSSIQPHCTHPIAARQLHPTQVPPLKTGRMPEPCSRAPSAMQDAVALRQGMEAHIKEVRAAARQTQIGHHFIEHPAPKMAEMGELVVSKIQSTQHIASTNDYSNDTLAVHSALDALLPQWEPWPNEALQAAMPDERSAAPHTSAVLAHLSSVTSVVRPPSFAVFLPGGSRHVSTMVRLLGVHSRKPTSTMTDAPLDVPIVTMWQYLHGYPCSYPCSCCSRRRRRVGTPLYRAQGARAWCRRWSTPASGRPVASRQSGRRCGAPPSGRRVGCTSASCAPLARVLACLRVAVFPGCIR